MSDERQGEDIDSIRTTYAQYESEGRGALWDRSNSGYDRLASERDARLLALLRASLPDPESATLLDVGCGTGTLAEHLATEMPELQVVGIDLLEERVAVARARVPTATFITGSADNLDFPDAAFDVASATTLFSSLPSPALERAIAGEIDRVIRPGGWLVWYDLRYDNPGNRAVHGISARAVAELFPGWRQELHSFSVLPPLARRLGRLTPVMYPLLHLLPPVRSHLIGRLQKP